MSVVLQLFAQGSIAGVLTAWFVRHIQTLEASKHATIDRLINVNVVQMEQLNAIRADVVALREALVERKSL